MLNIKLTVQQAEQMQHVTQILAYLFGKYSVNPVGVTYRHSLKMK